MGNRVHSGPASSRQGGRHSTIVSCWGPMSHSTRTWFRMCPGTRCSHQRRTLATSSSGSPGIWSVFQTVADVDGVGGPVPAGDLLRSRLQVPWPKWPTWPGQNLRLPKITAIEQRNRKDHPRSQRARSSGARWGPNRRVLLHNRHYQVGLGTASRPCEVWASMVVIGPCRGGCSQPPGFSIYPLIGKLWFLRGFELRFCACMLAGGVSGAPPDGCGARRWRRGAWGTLAACRAGSRCINVPGLRPGPRQDGARRPLTPYPLGKTARLRIDKPLNGWVGQPVGPPLARRA